MTATVCLCCFIIGLIFCTGAGEYWLKMFDSFAGTIGLVVIALMEMTAVIYVYGHEKYVEVHCVTFAIILDSLRTQIYGFYAILGLAMIFIK